MSCNGCRVLRRGCSNSCILRPCLQWIETPEAQGNATLFLSKFFGRSDLMSFIAAVPENKRPALFQSLLFEACGRTVNPVNGAVGLLFTGNWNLCQAAVETVLAGDTLRPVVTGILNSYSDEASEAFSNLKIAPTTWIVAGGGRNFPPEKYRRASKSLNSDESETLTSFEIGNEEEPKLLNLFV